MDLEKELFKNFEEQTPNYIKENKVINLDDKSEFYFLLKKEHLYSYSEENPEGLGLKDWFKGYEKEAKVSTAGIRGPQNILYPQDTRFPINIVGITLATLAKSLVMKEKYPNNKDLCKLAGREVRYNSSKFLEIITRIQAAQGIKTLVTANGETMPIWMASFLIFMLDLNGGEYITSSHGISIKNATKDLNNQGSQYLPEESLQFVGKIKEIFEETEKNGSYKIPFSALDNLLIDRKEMEKLNNGIDLYFEYLSKNVAKEEIVDLIKKLNNKIFIENVGGSAYTTLSKILKKFDVDSKYEWLNKEEEPFFHGIGKDFIEEKGGFYDWSVDAGIIIEKNNKKEMPVIETLNYKTKLKNYPVGTIVLITDPDHDRLTVSQIESCDNKNNLDKLGIDYVSLDEGRILNVYSANQAFLMLMNFWTELLKQSGDFDKYPRFIIKTTASSGSWDEWAEKNGIKVVNVPVGFKEIANIIRKVEDQIKEERDVIVRDVLGNDIELGKNPRLIFAGEESGGMIIGAEEIIKSKNGRMALAMKEKSAAEAIFLSSGLASFLEQNKMLLSDYLKSIYDKNEIISKFDVREDISYYNESETDIEKLKNEKALGEGKRTKNDLFFLTLALAKSDNIVTIKEIKTILSEIFSSLNFDNLNDVKFVGDGSSLYFSDKIVEIRPSGTDAKTKAYATGNDKEELQKYAKLLGNYEGELSDNYKKYISEDFYNNSKEYATDIYNEFTKCGNPKDL